MNIVIANTTIRTDSEGRYCLNDLHRAAGGEAKHQPAFWMRNAQTQALIEEIGASANSQTPVTTLNDGKNNGTYVAKELVYAYAMWISPAFHLKVIRAYDAMATQPASDPMAILSDPAAMRGLLLNYTEKVIALEEKVAEQAPKVEALERFAEHEGKFNTRDTAKMLGLPERKLIAWLLTHDWYYRDNSARLRAKASKIAAGYLDTVPVNIPRSDGIQTVPQPVITQRGLVRLGVLLAKDGLIQSKPHEDMFSSDDQDYRRMQSPSSAATRLESRT